MTAMVCVPGWLDSGEDHWQSLWVRDYPSSARVYQRDWQHPVRHEWIAGLEQTLAEQDEPVVLVAHSLGCSTVVHWAAQASASQLSRIRGALLVAPPDVDGETFLTTVPAQGFSPEPVTPLPFASILVASDNDRFCGLSAARLRAQHWGCELHVLAGAGHINANSKLRNWPAGQKLLQRLMLA
jgi:predicted alpha/beta hydrolase family esterase